MVKARKYIVTKRFEGTPKTSDYKILELELPVLNNGEILVKTEYISLDPYIRFANTTNDLPYDQVGLQVGIVLESKNPQFPVGTRVVSHEGWVDHYIGNPNNNSLKAHRERIVMLPDLKGLPDSYGVGAVGMSGASAYLGFLDITRPQAGETVVISGAAGGVGSIVGQIAKIIGCRVIGFTGSDGKVEYLEKELGFDKAYNYKKIDISDALKKGAPNGVDIYFDNVGGEISSTIMSAMNNNGRVSVFGSISSYGDPVLPKVTIVQPSILFKELEVKGFTIWNHGEKWQQTYVELVKLIKSGQIKVKEHIVEGFDKVPEAYIGMLTGENVGKAIVKL